MSLTKTAQSQENVQTVLKNKEGKVAKIFICGCLGIGYL